ncbi:hypothetical protein V6N00_02120 [Tersicoccus sp. MR15.9]|uniref:hypothetical protein n=1 Tax=Tersicoccus mangrovi TaxID=3121635 RepID=UPI002FE6B9A5
MSRESESRLTADGLSRNLGGEYAQEHGYGDAESYSDGSAKHVDDDHFHVHDEAAAPSEDTAADGTASESNAGTPGERGTTAQDDESAEPNEGRTEQLEQEAYGESGSGKSDPGAFTQAPG